jgi:hypothetical protein
VTLETASDGSIQVRDRFVFLRAGLLVASASFLGMAAMQRLYALDQGMHLGSSNLDLSRARDAVAIPLLALLGKSNQALV